MDKQEDNSKSEKPKKKWWIWVIVIALVGLFGLLFMVGGCYLLSKKGGDQQATDILKEGLTKEGYVALDEHKYSEARELFSKAIEADDQDAMAYIGRAKSYLYDPKNDLNFRIMASEDTEQAIVINENLADAFVFRAELFIRESEYGKAAEEVEKAIAKDENNIDAYLVKGYIQTRQGLTEEAEKDYAKAEKIDKNYPRLYVERGLHYVIEDKFEKAIKDYNKAIELDPRYEIAYSLLGFAYGQQDKYNEAKEQFEKAIEIYPEFPHAYINYGDILIQQGKFDKALEKFKEAEKIDPEYAPMKIGMGNYYYNKDEPDYPKSIEYYNDAIDIGYRYNWIFYSNRALAYRNIGNHKFAADDFMAAAEVNPDKSNTEYLVEAAESYFDYGDFQKAFDRANEVLAIDPSSASANIWLGMVYTEWPDHIDWARALDYINKSLNTEETFLGYANRGYVYYNQGKLDEAIRDLEKALQWKDVPEIEKAVSYNNICAAYTDKDDFDQAIMYCDKAIAADEKFSKPYYNLGVIYIEKGDINKARDYFGLALKYDPNYEQAKEAIGNL